MSSHLIDRENVRMIQRSSGFRFNFETLQTLGIGREKFRQYLDRDIAVQPRISGPIDLTHAASAKRTEDFVLTELRAGDQGHVRDIIARAYEGEIAVGGALPTGRRKLHLWPCVVRQAAIFATRGCVPGRRFLAAKLPLRPPLLPSAVAEFE